RIGAQPGTPWETGSVSSCGRRRENLERLKSYRGVAEKPSLSWKRRNDHESYLSCLRSLSRLLFFTPGVKLKLEQETYF
ncbi:hypothetical protein XENOCAPTIV_004989, partial [Xenoophorus captivus]